MIRDTKVILTDRDFERAIESLNGDPIFKELHNRFHTKVAIDSSLPVYIKNQRMTKRWKLSTTYTQASQEMS